MALRPLRRVKCNSSPQHSVPNRHPALSAVSKSRGTPLPLQGHSHIVTLSIPQILLFRLCMTSRFFAPFLQTIGILVPECTRPAGLQLYSRCVHFLVHSPTCLGWGKGVVRHEVADFFKHFGGFELVQLFMRRRRRRQLYGYRCPFQTHFHPFLLSLRT